MKEINLKRTIKRIAFIDTETIGTLTSPETCLPFDISIKWYDNKTDKVLKQKCYLVRPFINNKYIMGSTFSASKYPYYLEEIATNKDYFVGSVNAIMKDIAHYNKKFGVKIASAYNDSFDKTVVGRLCKEFDTTNPFANMDWLDLMQVSKELINSVDYYKFCNNNKDYLIKKGSDKVSKFITPSGRLKATAESVYCYIINDVDFKEEHTGLEDLNIELAIFRHCKHTNNNKMVELNTPKPHWTFAPTL